MSVKKEYILEGLCCPNCAAKIEKEVGDLDEVHEAKLNFVNQRLSISTTDAGAEGLTERIGEIVRSHEPSVMISEVTDNNDMHKSVSENEKESEKNGIRGYLIRIIAAAALVFLLLVVKLPASIETAIFILAYGLAGYETLLTAARNILKGRVFDENFLMGIASLGAFLIGERVEAIAVLVFYGVGELLQDIAVDRSRKNIAKLMDIRPDYANKILDGTVSVVAPEQVEVRDMILIKPGEKVPLDGIIRKGGSFVDTKALTGESLPREVSEGDEVLSGAVNMNGVLEVEVTKPYGESTVSRILELVQNASSKKSESEKFITKFARYYTPAVVFAAVAVALVPPLLGFGEFTSWLYRALSFLIISCPCALVISIPLSFFGGIGGGARQGILVKGGNFLDALKQVDTIIFDKTGTLTKGIFEVASVFPEEGIDASQLVRLATVAESQSNHPIAKSIMAYYDKSIDEPVPAADMIKETAGLGVTAEYNGITILAGNEKLMEQNGLQAASPDVAGSVVHVAADGKYLGHLLICDELKPSVKDAIAALKQIGVRRTVMLTGDHENAAKEIAGLSQVDEYQAELLPQDKVAWLEQYKSSVTGKGKVVFVGDGINDAPVLAGADIGIAMGGIGSDAAIEAADVVIMNDDPGKIVTAIKIARKTGKIVIQNIIFALGVKLLIMVLAFFNITSIWFAIFADVGVALLALFNAMRAMYIK